MNRKSKLLSLLLSLALVFSVSTGVFAADEEKAEETPVTPYAVSAEVKDKLVILHTNDTHGSDVADPGKCIGTAGVAALKKAFEAAGAKVLLFSAGDFSQGSPLVSLDQGASAVAFMNAAGYDAATLGNHEFDYKTEPLKANLAAAKFPVLAANVVDKETGKALSGDRVIFDTPIGKVGVFGLDTPEAMTKAHPDNVKGLTFYQGDELVKCAQAEADALKKDGASYIVALTHLGVDAESEPNRSTDVFAKVTGVDLVIDGHSHTEMEGETAVKAGSAVIVSTGTALANVGVVVTDGKTTETELVPAAAWTEVDSEVAEVVDARNAAVDAQLSETFATTAVVLNGAKAPGNRTEETNLGDFAADAILWAAKQALGEDKADVALTNGGGIRATIEVGDITMKTMKTVFPFGNEVATISLTGAEILEALEAATYCTPTAVGAFPQVAGMSFTIDTGVPYAKGEQYPDSTYYAPAAPGTRIQNLVIGSDPVDLEKTYILATNDFTAAGGDTYGVFKDKPMTKTGVALEDALVNYTKTVMDSSIYAADYGTPKGRITVIDPLKGYTDVTAGAWYEEPIRTAVGQKWMVGTSDTTFEPETVLTRAQVLQTLYNVDGQKDTKATVATTLDWAQKALNWAADTGLIDGTKAYEDAEITRAETMDLFDVYTKSVGKSAEGLFLGNQNGEMMVDKALTRAEYATVLGRLAAK